MSLTSFVTHLECANCEKDYPPDRLAQTCQFCNRPLLVIYALDELKPQLKKRDLESRPPTLWRYAELLPCPLAEEWVSLSETMTPMVPARRLAEHFNVREFWIKDESRLPTGSFKARGMAMAVTMAKAFGVKKVAAPTAGNAGGALAAYAARAGLEAWVLMPDDTPVVNQMEPLLYGATANVHPGRIDECGKIVAERCEKERWFNMATLREPYRIEGKKTMGLELAEQMDWKLPDWIFYPTGGGTGLIGMWKAFNELQELGWLQGKMPKMVACQSEGCAPIVKAFESGTRFAKRFPNPQTAASGLNVPSALGDFMILDALKESGGVAVSCPDSEIQTWMQNASSKEGLSICPETAICLAAVEKLQSQGKIKNKDRIVVFNTGAAQKYVEAFPLRPTPYIPD